VLADGRLDRAGDACPLTRYLRKNRSPHDVALACVRRVRARTSFGAHERVTTTLIVGLVWLILSAAIAIFAGEHFDYPVVMFVNSFRKSKLFDSAMFGITALFLLKTVVLVAGIWLVWFDAPDAESRARVVAGLIATCIAAMVSRGIQVLLPIHAHPFRVEAIDFIHPRSVPVEYWNLSSFPSGHGAVLFGVAMVIAIIRPRLALVAFAWASVVMLSGIYQGQHFPTDIMGAAGLGVAFVCASQLPAIRKSCLVFPRWAIERAGVFYAVAFIVTFEICLLFDDIREVGKEFTKVLQ
jgi:membrane-associated phospholipid phosphatase